MAVLTAVVAVGFLPIHALGILAPVMTVDLSTSLAGFSVGPSALFGFAAAVSLLLARGFSRGTPRLWIGAMLGASAVGWAVVAAAPTYGLVVLGLALCGVPLAACLPIVNRVAHHSLPDVIRGTSVGVAQSGSQFSAIVVGGLLPLAVTEAGWRSSVAMIAAIAALLTVASLRLTLDREDQRSSERRTSAAPDAAALGAFGLYAFVMGSVVTLFFVFLPTYLVSVLGTTLTEAGWVVVGNSVIALVAKTVWGWGAHRVAHLGPYLVVVSAGTGLAFVGLSYGSGSLMLTLISSATVAAIGVPWPTVQMVALLRLESPETAAVVAGRTMTFGFVGMAAGPPLFAVVARMWGLDTAWLVGGAFVTLGVPAAWAYARGVTRTLVTASTSG